MKLSKLRNTLFSSFLIAIITVAAVLHLFGGRFEVKAQLASLNVLPSTAYVMLGEKVAVYVNITNVMNLYGYEIKVWYLNSVVSTTRASVVRLAGHFLEPLNPANQFEAKWTVDNAYNATHGQIWCSLMLLYPEVPRNGSGMLFRITFTGVGEGTSPIIIDYPNEPYPAILEEGISRLPIPHAAQDGLIDVVSKPAIVNALPSTARTMLGHTVTVDVNITDVANLFCYEIQVWFLRSVVNTTVDSVVRPIGNFLEPSDPVNQWVVKWTVDYSNATYGMIFVAYTLFHPEPMRSGSGLLFRITFTGVGEGTTPIIIDYPGEPYPAILTDGITGALIPNTANNGLITVTTNSSDCNGDGVVNILDLTIAAAAFGSYPGQQRWNEAADVRKDDIINVLDLVAIALHFGQ